MKLRKVVQKFSDFEKGVCEKNITNTHTLAGNTLLMSKITNYLEWMDHKGMAPNTITRYEGELRLILEYFHEVGIIETEDLTIESVKVLESWMLDKKLKPRSRAKTLSVFKSFTKYLKETNQIFFDIGEKVTMPKFSRSQKEVPSREEIKNFLSIPDTTTEEGLRDFLILSLTYYTGMRAGEVSNIFVQNINLQERSIKIFGKGGHSRFVYFPLSVGIKLNHYLKQNKYFTLFPGLTSNQVTYLATKYFGKAELPQTGAHILRYSIATHLFERGVNVRIVQTMLGHKHVSSTYEYIMPRIDYLKEIHSKHHPSQNGAFGKKQSFF